MELFAEIERAAPVELLSRLVQIPSHQGVERQERSVATALASYLEERGLSPLLQEVRDGRPNLLCTLEGPEPGSHLLLCGHTDTVPLNEDDPGYRFSGEVRDGRLQGRGAVDMKGALAAMAAALVGLERNGSLSGGKLTLAAVVDEEMESLGAEHLIASGFAADGAIVGEPTENRIALGHRGLEWLEFLFHGRAAHGGASQAGINAIDAAVSFVQLAREELLPGFAERVDPLLGPPTLNFGTIHGGDQPSTVAAACALTAARRSLPGEDFASISAEFEELLARVAAEMPGLRTELRRVPGGMGNLEHLALKTSPADPVVAAAAAARHEVCGSVGELGAFPAWTDGALLAAFGGLPTIIMGPGDLALAHSPRESIEIDQVLEAAKLYAATALRFCGRRP